MKTWPIILTALTTLAAIFRVPLEWFWQSVASNKTKIAKSFRSAFIIIFFYLIPALNIASFWLEPITKSSIFLMSYGLVVILGASLYKVFSLYHKLSELRHEKALLLIGELTKRLPE